MIQHYLLRPGFFSKILAKEPLCSIYVPIIAKDPPAKRSPPDDSFQHLDLAKKKPGKMPGFSL